MHRLPLLIACTALSLCLCAAEPDGAWQKLGTLERSNVYTILLRDKTCHNGRIRRVESDELVLDSGFAASRSQILFLGEGLNAHDILYSGRSSWDEVKQVHASPLEKLSVRLKTGKSLSGADSSASDLDLTIKRYGHSMTLPKRDIAEVDYLRFKPVSEAHAYFDREGGVLKVFDPKVLQYLLRIDALMSVRIYDTRLPEDNSPLACDQNSKK